MAAFSSPFDGPHRHSEIATPLAAIPLSRIPVSPPTTFVTPCPNPNCSEIPFPHDIDHVLMIHELPMKTPASKTYLEKCVLLV